LPQFPPEHFIQQHLAVDVRDHPDFGKKIGLLLHAGFDLGFVGFGFFFEGVRVLRLPLQVSSRGAEESLDRKITNRML
jgi:hypothetical protein